MITQSLCGSRVLLIRLDTGEDILDGICHAVRDAGIRHGLILGAIGSVSQYHVHVVDSVDMPPSNAFVQGGEAYDIQTISGAILDGRPHAHITLANTQGAIGGHLEEGCRVLTFSMIYVMETPAGDLTDWDHLGVVPNHTEVDH